MFGLCFNGRNGKNENTWKHNNWNTCFSIIAWVTGLAKFNGVVSSPPPMTYLFEFDLGAALHSRNVYNNIYFIVHRFFDTAGTLTSVANVAGKVSRDGKVKDINKAMLI